MININDPNHRSRLGRSHEYAFTESMRFNRMRADTVEAYLGVSPADCDYDYASYAAGRHARSTYEQNLPKGNLLQMSGIGTQIALAYGEPQFMSTARMPDHIGTAESLEPALNRMATLLNFGDTARAVAADSFFGYGIFKVGVGVMPLAAQIATGMRIGPCIWRVGQPDYIYDVTVDHFDKCGFMGDLYTLPLNEAQELYPEDADRLAEITEAERIDSARVMARANRYATPEPMVLLYDCYIPGSNIIATWPIRQQNFRSIADAPLKRGVRDYNGHWSGIYGVLTHLYSPDELVPIAQAENVKALHYLFNDILELTSEQARHAKYNPTYTNNGEKDMQKLWNATDRVPVGITNNSTFGSFEIPGPTQSQTAYMSAIMQLFKQMSFNLDAQLGLAPTSGTATQSSLIAERTNAMTAEMRRKFLRTLQLVGYKLAHLLMEDQNLYLPLTRQLMPGSKIKVDVSWLPPNRAPRNSNVDDYDISVESFSLKYRDPEERLQQIATISNQIILPAFAAQAKGFPIDGQEVLNTAAKYSGNPELRDWYQAVDPVYTEQKQTSRMTAQRPDVGRYVRENVSEKSNNGALQEALTQMAAATGSEGTRVE